MVFSANYRVLTKVLRQEKGYRAKTHQGFPNKPWTFKQIVVKD